MRTWIFAVLTAIAAGLVGVAPASAAWTCNGPEYVCGSAPAKSVASSTYAKPKAAASYKASKKAKPSYASDDDKPVLKKKKAAKVARSSDDDEAPKKSYKAKKSSGGGDGGGSHYQSGMASYYWQPQKLASGGWFNPNAMTAAHKTLPFGTKVRVTNKHNGQSVVVTINDRGPYIGGRVIDLSKAAAGAINMQNAGVVPVNVAVLGK